LNRPAARAAYWPNQYAAYKVLRVMLPWGLITIAAQAGASHLMTG
jgi:hypothetical protein